MTIIIDSNYLFALKSKKDKNHQRSLKLIKEVKENYNKPIITNYLVINELFTLVNSRFKGNPHYLDQYYSLIWGEDNFFNIIKLISEQHQNCYELLKKYTTSKRILSFVDASLIFLFQKLNASVLLSFDDHFDNIITRLF